MSHADRHFTIVANKDGSNAHAVTGYSTSEQNILCRGYTEQPARLGKNVVVADVGCYEDVATYQGELCDWCRHVAGRIAATEIAFALRNELEAAYREGKGIVLSPAELQTVLTAYAPWEAEGLTVRPDGERLSGERDR